MIYVLGILARFSIFAGLILAIFFNVSDLFLKTNYMENIDKMIDYSDARTKILFILIALFYLVVLTLYNLNKWTKYSKNRKVKSKNGEIEVSLKTINDIAKEYFKSHSVIKNVKVKSYASGKSVIIEAFIDSYSSDELKDKIADLQDNLSKEILEKTGITVKKSKIKLKKVLKEKVIEKKVITELEEVEPLQKETNDNGISEMIISADNTEQDKNNSEHEENHKEMLKLDNNND